MPTLADLPDTPLVRAAHDTIVDVAPPAIVNHSRRVFALASSYAAQRGIAFDAERLAIVSLLHDLGLCRVDGARPFTNVGSRAVAELCRGHLDGAAIAELTDAIDNHLLPLPRFQLGAIVGLLEVGTWMDATGLRASRFRDDMRTARAAHPVLDFRRCFYAGLFRSMRSPASIVGLWFPRRWSTSRMLRA